VADDAFLAATAEHLAREFALRIPPWPFKPSRYLERPYFALQGAAFRATLLLESPLAFRSRNLFVTANALCRVGPPSTPADRLLHLLVLTLGIGPLLSGTALQYDSGLVRVMRRPNPWLRWAGPNVICPSLDSG
jgi:hypothetical protein